MQVYWVLAIHLCALEAELQHPFWLLKRCIMCIYGEGIIMGLSFFLYLFSFPFFSLMHPSIFVTIIFCVIKNIIAWRNVFHISFSTSSYNRTCFTSFKYLKQSAQFSNPVLPTEIWLISYICPFPLDFTSIMTDSRTIWSMMIFLAYSITFFSLMIILKDHFFLCAHKSHYFFVWRSCLVCSITSFLWEIH